MTMIRPKSHDEWLAARSKGIGSSEIGTIIGLNPYETPYQLWRRKVGMDAPKEENEAMLLGHLLEDAVAQRWQMATSRDIIKKSAEEWIYVHPEKDYFRASPDRIYYMQGDKHNEKNKCILECKTTILDVDSDNIPQSWFCQVQWLMHVTGYERASLAWLKLDRREFGYEDIKYDPEFCAFLAEEADKFWTKNIIGGVEPTASNNADLKLKYPRHIDGKTVSSDGTINVDGEDVRVVNAIMRIKELQESIAELDEQKTALENAIKMYMCDAEAITHEEFGKTINIATWRTAKDTQKFDSKAFQKDHPEEAALYTKNVAGSRRFIIK